MPWDGSPGHGFTSGQPWLPIGAQAATHNVRCEREMPGSILALYHRLLALRRQEPVLSVGEYGRVWAEGDVLAYERIDPETHRTFLIELNLAATTASIALDARDGGQVLIDTHSQREGERVSGQLTLAANEG